jgi:hypothetical protein
VLLARPVPSVNIWVGHTYTHKKVGPHLFFFSPFSTRPCWIEIHSQMGIDEIATMTRRWDEKRSLYWLAVSFVSTNPPRKKKFYPS